jgi:hypothetical protein
MINPGGIAPKVLSYQSETEDAINSLPAWWDEYHIDVEEILQGKAVRKLDQKNESGQKYLKRIVLKTAPHKAGKTYIGIVDVYAVQEAFGVRCPAVAHAVKKLLCPGARGSKDIIQDLKEAIDAMTRAVTMAESRKDLLRG